jgi:prolyl-tRNA synthetase
LLSPTCEELYTDLFDKAYANSLRAGRTIKIYQINYKFRKELRPRGMARTREFIMKDGYSISREHSEALNILFQIYRQYVNIFNALGLEVKIGAIDDDSMGDGITYEFVVPTDSGEGKYRDTKRGNFRGMISDINESETG